VQGANALACLDKELARLGRHAACLIDAAIADSIAPFFSDLPGVRTSLRLLEGKCTVNAVNEISAWIGKGDADVVVACGGGSLLDIGRAAADKLGLPLVCVPTVAASDAPCSGLSVVYDEQGHMLEDRFVRHPALVLVDTAVLVTAPVRFFVSGIGDALATWYEADACRRSGAGNLCGGCATQLALEAARLSRGILLRQARQAVHDCAHRRLSKDFEDVIEATVLLSGLGFESGGVAAAHAIHHGLCELPSTKNYLHGEKVAIGVLASHFLPHSFDQGGDRAGDQAREDLFAFCNDVGLPVTLAQVGVDVDDDAGLLRVARRACRAGEIIHNEPEPVTAEGLAAALRAMDEFGGKFYTAGVPRQH